MTVVALQGLQGGAGTTSIAASLSWALASLGERVLAVDLCPDNMLRLHYNMPFDSPRGWARAERDGVSWRAGAMRSMPNLDFLPFGQLSLNELKDWTSRRLTQEYYWLDKLDELKRAADYQWIVFDLPFSYPLAEQALVDAVDSHICVITPSMNNHIRLYQQALPQKSKLLVNKLSANSLLQEDIHLLWLQSLDRLLPLTIHQDEAVPESLAAKKTVGEYAQNSLAAGEVLTLANWCLINSAGHSS